jgi:hypothetical protein
MHFVKDAPATEVKRRRKEKGGLRKGEEKREGWRGMKTRKDRRWGGDRRGGTWRRVNRGDFSGHRDEGGEGLDFYVYTQS